MSFERIVNLANQLPEQSRTKIKIFGFKPLSQIEHLLMDVLDFEAFAVWQRANTGVAKGKQSPRPKPFPRPGQHLIDQKKTDNARSMRQRLLEQKERLGIKTIKKV